MTSGKERFNLKLSGKQVHQRRLHLDANITTGKTPSYNTHQGADLPDYHATETVGAVEDGKTKPSADFIGSETANAAESGEITSHASPLLDKAADGEPQPPAYQSKRVAAESEVTGEVTGGATLPSREVAGGAALQPSAYQGIGVAAGSKIHGEAVGDASRSLRKVVAGISKPSISRKKTSTAENHFSGLDRKGRVAMFEAMMYGKAPFEHLSENYLAAMNSCWTHELRDLKVTGKLPKCYGLSEKYTIKYEKKALVNEAEFFAEVGRILHTNVPELDHLALELDDSLYSPMTFNMTLTGTPLFGIQPNVPPQMPVFESCVSPFLPSCISTKELYAVAPTTQLEINEAGFRAFLNRPKTLSLYQTMEAPVVYAFAVEGVMWQVEGPTGWVSMGFGGKTVKKLFQMLDIKHRIDLGEGTMGWRVKVFLDGLLGPLAGVLVAQGH